mmetsp:Transcript_8183/g.13223  ORF Transcript_8183/g.13223 Transcript_8183/m.13223 type:complete len:93 (+) Transcript_8183:950-1228(+)
MLEHRSGVDVREIGPDEVSSLFPLCRTDDIMAGFYVEGDGRVNPVDAATALAKGARMKGARVIENAPIAAVATNGGKVTGVRVDLGGGEEVG